jgi:hypothetical protein
MIIYSDGAEESMDGRVGYPEELRSIVDYFGTRNDSFCQKKGIIRKSYNGKQFDIEIWTMGPIPMVEKPYTPSTKVESKKIEISNLPNGKSPKVPVEINVEEPFTVKWKNATGTTKINVQIKKGNTYTNIATSEKDGYYTIDKKASSGTITFYEPQDYKVIVADENSRDERYVKAKGNVLKDVFPVIIIVIIIIGGVLLWKLLSKPRPTPDWGNRNGNVGNNSNNNDDWN